MLTAKLFRQQKKCLLIVDDDAVLREMLIRYFEQEGFAVLGAENGQQMQALLEKHPVDLVVLDIVLPDQDGCDLAQALRQRNPYIGIILFSGRKIQEIERIVGLEKGADDYVVKSTSPRELLARIKAVLRRSESGEKGAQSTRLLRFNGWELDVAGQSLRSPGGELVHLTSGECLILCELVRQAGKICSRDFLLNVLERAGCGGSNDRSLDVQVSRLRNKLQDKQERALIATIHGKGYAFRGRIA